MAQRRHKVEPWQLACQRGRVFVLVWSRAGASHLSEMRRKLAYAQQLQKPIRILRTDGPPIPEDLCLGHQDLQTAYAPTPEDAVRQIERWLDEITQREQEGV
jgi:hypothetical protein